MNVSIKSFEVQMDVKNKGVEFEVRNLDNKHLGDLVLTKTQLIGCAGKTSSSNGKKVSWDTFI